MKRAVIIGAGWPDLKIQVSDTKEILSCDPFVGCALSMPEDVDTIEGYKQYIYRIILLVVRFLSTWIAYKISKGFYCHKRMI